MEEIKKQTIEILHQQIQLLAEKSKVEELDAETLIRISAEIDRLGITILNAIDC